MRVCGWFNTATLVFFLFVFVMAEPNAPSTAIDPGAHSQISWSLCVLCQEGTEEGLQCPVNIRRSDIGLGSGYKSLEESISAFSNLGCIPLPFDISKLDEGDGIEATLKCHAAKWHKNCRNKFNSLKLQRAVKRKNEGESDPSTPTVKRTRKSFGVPHHQLSLTKAVFSVNIKQNACTKLQHSI